MLSPFCGLLNCLGSTRTSMCPLFKRLEKSIFITVDVIFSRVSTVVLPSANPRGFVDGGVVDEF
jgi:hypothetical protein